MKYINLFYYRQSNGKYLFSIPDTDDYWIVYNKNTEPKFAIGKIFTNTEDGCAVPEIWNDETEEQYFQSSLIWDCVLDINLGRAIQKAIINCNDLDTNSTLYVQLPVIP